MSKKRETGLCSLWWHSTPHLGMEEMPVGLTVEETIRNRFPSLNLDIVSVQLNGNSNCLQSQVKNGDFILVIPVSVAPNFMSKYYEQMR